MHAPISNITEKWTGIKQLGVLGAEIFVSSIAVDLNGNVYVAGTTSSGLDSNTIIGTTDSFVVKYDSFGKKIRTIEFGVPGTVTVANSIDIDSSGNIYVAGGTYCGLDDNTLTGNPDFFVSTFDPSGNKVRTKQLGVPDKSTYAKGVALDSSQNV